MTSGLPVTVRAERAGDADAIRRVTEEAFCGAPYADGTEAEIADRLRLRGELTVSVVAEAAGVVVAHAAASPVRVSDGSSRWFVLGPVAVAPAQQGRGIGTAVVQEVVARLRDAGACGCVVVGDPRYYRRFGFGSTDGLTSEGVPDEHLMALVLEGGAPTGIVTFSPAFSPS